MSGQSGKRFAAAMAAHHAGKVANAARGFRSVLSREPGHAGALYMLGTSELREGRVESAVDLLRRSTTSHRGFAPAHSNLGVALAAIGRHDDAVAAFQAAIALDGSSGTAFLALSASLLAVRKPGLALDAAARAARSLPQLAAPHANMAAALVELGRTDEAEACYRAALACDQAHGESLRGLADLLRASGRDLPRTVELLERAAATDAGPGTLVELAELRRGAGDMVAASDSLRRAEARHPDDPLVRLAAAMAPLAPLYPDRKSREHAVAEYAEALGALDTWARAGGPGRMAGLADALGRAQPFYLPYAVEDVLPLQRLYGRLAADATVARYGEASITVDTPTDGERIRLGIVSGFVREHSVWKVPLRGWLAGLDRARFSVTLYHVGQTSDAVTTEARGLVDVLHHEPRSTAAWRARILADRPHVLIHAEVGMNGAAFRLAAMRLAPIQCVGPGHPVTTGLPTMDLFLSSDAMEPSDGAAHYSERLVRLPELGFPWRPPASAAASTDAPLPLLPAGIRYFCGQSPFKYRPEDDALLVGIARAVPDARFVFIAGAGEAGLGERLADRLSRAFAAAGLDWSVHGHVVGRVPPSVFASITGACDVVLDNPSWSGCNSTLEGLVGRTPVLTLPGPTMRSRHTAAILQRVGFTEGMARDRDDYVAKAVALGIDPARRNDFRDRLRGITLACLDDQTTVRALEAEISAAIVALPQLDSR